MTELEHSAGRRPPRVFVSYSWDDDAHRQWVLRLAERLVQDGVDVVLDQWVVQLGTNLPAFMARSFANSDFVLLVLTPGYKEKEAGNRGGVRFEASMVTGEMLQHSADGRFVPVLRRGPWQDAAPPWAVGLNRVDLSGMPYIESEYHHLLDHLRGSRPRPPTRGSARTLFTRDALVTELQSVIRSPMVAGMCQWQLKESQVVRGIPKPDASGFYPVLVGLEMLTLRGRAGTIQQRDALIAWSLGGDHYDTRDGWFLLRPRRDDPADPPARDIRHTGEIGIALAIDNRAQARGFAIIDKIAAKQGDGCPPGSWRSSDAAACADPMSSVVCAELMARGRDWTCDDVSRKERLDASLNLALHYLERSMTPRGWRYEGLNEPYWETWGASIVGFRLRHHLTSVLREHVIHCIVEEIERTDILLGPWDQTQRVRLLTRYLAALVAINWTDDRITQWREFAVDLWLRLDPDTQDVSTKLHLAFLLAEDVLA